jgi:hypothetical protein
MKSSTSRNLIVFTSCVGTVLALGRCSPNTASITKAMLAQMSQPRIDTGAPISPAPARDQVELHTHLLGDASYAEQLSGLTQSDFLIRISGDDIAQTPAGAATEYPLTDDASDAGADKFREFKKSGAVEIVLPANLGVPAKGDAYLDVDLTKDQKAAIGDDFKLVLSRSASEKGGDKSGKGTSRWTLSTTPDGSSAVTQGVLEALSKLSIRLPSTTPSPSHSPNPTASPQPVTAPVVSAADL